MTARVTGDHTPLEARALFALWRSHPDTPTSDRWGERAHRRARLQRDMLLAWAATRNDDQLLDCRNFGAKSLVWVRANQTSTPADPPGLDVERLRELSDAATPGPWTKTTFGNASTARAAGVMSSFAYATARHAGVPMTDLTVIDGPDGRYAVGFTGNGPHSPENAALIVAAVNALRDALASEDRP